jgi:hypothetical protein
MSSYRSVEILVVFTRLVSRIRQNRNMNVIHFNQLGERERVRES